MSDVYNLKDEMKEIIKSHGGRAFFNELNAAHIPFFFVAAVENTEQNTEYLCEAITPGSIGLLLKDDKFPDFLDIRNKGFITVPSREAASLSIQGLKIAQETDRKPFYDEEALMQFAREEGIVIEDNINDGDEYDDDTLKDDVVQYVIKDQEKRDGAGPEPGYMLTPVYQEEIIDITWGTSGAKNRAYTDEFSKLDERHQEILKGDGSFLQVKEREVVYNNGQHPKPAGDSLKTEEIGEIGETEGTVKAEGEAAAQEMAEGAWNPEDTENATDAGNTDDADDTENAADTGCKEEASTGK